MKMKKTIVSLLSVSAVVLSIGGQASAKEATQNSAVVPESQTAPASLAPIEAKLADFNIQVGHAKPLPSHLLGSGFSYHSDNKAVFTVDAYGIVTGQSVGQGKLTVFKNGSLYGQLSVSVYR
ncbi:hypothetical protein EGI09_13945 [Bacillus subtilis]|nr:hypothetical protein [Bacillus subtilis]